MTSKLVIKGIRTKLKKAMASKPVMAAVAYVSDVEVFPLGVGDTVVCDASKHAAAAGSTRKEALLALLKAKVKVWSVQGLHAKAVVTGEQAFVGSANWSASSDGKLKEAVLQTDDQAVAGAAKVHRGPDRGRGRRRGQGFHQGPAASALAGRPFRGR